MQDPARSAALERQFRRYHPQRQRAVRGLAAQHKRIADLALSFPALLFALAVPRLGLDRARAVECAVEGAALAEVAATAGVPLWLRRLPPEAFERPIATLPDNKLFRRQIANHLPSSKVASIWLQAVAEMNSVAHEAAAVWIAREIARQKRDVNLGRLRLIGFLAWFSGQSETLGHEIIPTLWTPEMSLGSAVDAAGEWRMTIGLHADLGCDPIGDLWLQPGHMAGYDFLPLTSASEIAAEAMAMRNCLLNYGYNLAHNHARLWSVRKDGRRVATLMVASHDGDPLPNVVELRAAGNKWVSPEVSWAARQWLHRHELRLVDMKPHRWGTVPLDRAAWVSV